MKRCPVCGGEKFIVAAHVVQEWTVNQNGDFISCVDECREVVHRPDDDDIWDCEVCGYSNNGSAFNVDEETNTMIGFPSVYDISADGGLTWTAQWLTVGEVEKELSQGHIVLKRTHYLTPAYELKADQPKEGV